MLMPNDHANPETNEAIHIGPLKFHSNDNGVWSGIRVRRAPKATLPSAIH